MAQRTRCTRGLAGLLLLGALAACKTTTEVTSPETSSAELLERSDRYFDARQYENALESYKMAAVAAKTEGEKGRLVEATAQVAHVYVMTGLVDEGRVWLRQASEWAARDEPGGWARWTLVRGVYENEDGARSAAVATFGEAYEFSLSTGQATRAVQAAYMASVAAEGEDQIRWCRKSIEVARTMGDPRLVAALWRQLGWMLEERGLVTDALVAFDRARSRTLELNDARAQIVADWSYGHALRKVGRSEEARVLMTDVAQRAQQRYQSRRQANDAEWVGHSMEELAELDLLDGKSTSALRRLRNARASFIIAGADRYAPETLAAIDRRIAEVRRLVETEEG